MSEDQKKAIAKAIFIVTFCLIYAVCIYAEGLVFGSLIFFGAIFIALVLMWADSVLKDKQQ